MKHILILGLFATVAVIQPAYADRTEGLGDTKALFDALQTLTMKNVKEGVGITIDGKVVAFDETDHAMVRYHANQANEFSAGVGECCDCHW
jgi:hypothetical protein